MSQLNFLFKMSSTLKPLIIPEQAEEVVEWLDEGDFKHLTAVTMAHSDVRLFYDVIVGWKDEEGTVHLLRTKLSLLHHVLF